VADDRAEGDERDDRALLAAHVTGDPTAFGILARRHQNRLWAVGLRTTGNREDAADAVQEALLSAYRNAASYRGDAAVTTWLHRIVVNASLDLLRRKAARPAVPLPDDADRIPAQGDAMDARETSLVVQEALATLPPEQRAALVLVDVQGWSVDDAARVLDCAPGTVKSRCFRGRAKLAPLLAHLRSGGAQDTQPLASGNHPPEQRVPIVDADTETAADRPTAPARDSTEGGERRE
jgi:RNA polymerase sigma-70 factor, ECF subfamily